VTPGARLRQLLARTRVDAVQEIEELLPGLVARMLEELGKGREDCIHLELVRCAVPARSKDELDAALLHLHLDHRLDLLVANNPSEHDRRVGISTSAGVYVYVSPGAAS